MVRWLRVGLAFGLLAPSAACAPRYSPNTYSTAAVQQANPVERGVVIGARKVDVSAPGVIGAAAGGAAGGIAGAQTPGGDVGSAFGALGGALIGGLVGSGVEHAATDTTAWEYIVQEPKGALVSVTQKDKTPLAVGTKVLVIAGKQARIVRDYTEAATEPALPAAATPPAPTQTAPPPPAVTATPLAPLPPLPAFNPAPPSGQ